MAVVGRWRGRWLWALGALVGATAAVVYAAAVVHVPAFRNMRPVIAWPVLAALFALSEAVVVHLHFRADTDSISVSELPLVLGLFFATPPHLVLAQVVGAAAGLALVRRQRPSALVMNLATLSLQCMVALLVFHALVRHDPISVQGWVAAMAATAASAGIGVAATVAAIVVSHHRAPRARTVPTFALGLTATFITANFAVVAALALRDDSLSAVPLLFMTVVLLLAFRAYGKERTRLDSLEFLHRASQVTQGTGDLDEILVTLLEHVREMFQATAAELVMLDERGGGAKLRTTVGLGPVPEVMAPDESVLTRTALLSVSSSPACIVRAQLGQAMVARLVDDAGVLGALVAATPADASGVFTKEQLRLFEALANHVTVSLVNGTLERSITQLRELHHQLSHKASHDPLTGLANRALFRSRLQDSVDTVESGLAVLFIDLDDFKVVNDTLGHEAGDQLLSVVASRIERCARTGDVAARVGGDEFAVLLHDVDDAAATAVADRILADLRAPMALDGRRVSTRASIGLVMVDHRGPADEFMRQADIAMYSAKHAGKGRYRFLAHEVGTGAVTRRALKEDLQRALRSDEFENYYQPIVDVPSGIVVGVESLVRWHHPSAGLVQPDHFIPLAEETGAIVPMGRKVLESACRDAAYWRSLNSALTLNVNISARQLHGESFVDDLSRALSASGLPAEALIIEITESTTVGDIDAVVAKLQAAKDLGVRVALDHFGTGYSSLAQMRRLPIDELKIPKPFIDEVGGTTQDRRGVTLVHAIARLGQTLGLEVVAEGIERVEQYEQLKRLPLSGGQGYFFGRPVDAEEMSALIRLESRGTASGPHMNEAMPA